MTQRLAPTAFMTTVHVGRIQPLGPAGVSSGFVKSAVNGRVHVRSLGLEGDEQADLRVHGGMDKAVYGYATENYVAWRADFPEHAALFVPGGVGENLAIQGLDEHSVCLGDQHLIGTALLGVCQHRQPCHKFALRFNDPRVVRAMVRNGRCGWYYRVIRDGFLEARRGFREFEWAELAALPGLPKSGGTRRSSIASARLEPVYRCSGICR